MANRKNWIKPAVNRMKRKGTVGSFTSWCKRHGYEGVNASSIAAGRRAGGKIAKKAVFADNMRKARHAKGGTIGQEEFSIGGIFGEAAIGAGSGAMMGLAGGPLAPITSGIGALIGGGAGLIKGLLGHRQENLQNLQTERMGEQIGEQKKLFEQQRLDANQDQYIAGIESNQAVNPFTPTFEYGGKMKKVKAEVEGGETLYNPRTEKGEEIYGADHNDGGVDVEKEVGTLVFSDDVINPLTGNTYANDTVPLFKRLAQLDKQLV